MHSLSKISTWEGLEKGWSFTVHTPNGVMLYKAERVSRLGDLIAPHHATHFDARPAESFGQDVANCANPQPPNSDMLVKA